MTYQTLQNTFERELLFQIITNLRKQKISSIQAKRVAQAFLPVLKSETVEEFIQKLSKLSYGYPEIMETFIMTIKAYEKEEVGEKLSLVRTELGGGEKIWNQ